MSASALRTQLAVTPPTGANSWEVVEAAVEVINTTLGGLVVGASTAAANPGSDASQAFAVQGVTGGKTIPVSIPETAVTLSISSVSSGATIAAGKHHIEFALTSDFDGTIGGVAILGSVFSKYSPGDTSPGYKFPALIYTISAGSAILTTW